MFEIDSEKLSEIGVIFFFLFSCQDQIAFDRDAKFLYRNLQNFRGKIFMLGSLGYDLDTVVYTYSNTFFLLVFSESFGGFLVEVLLMF